MSKKRRMANIELLRILAMAMVIMLHYLGKGDLLPSLAGPLGVNGYLAWILETLSIVAVNVYVLISGYFLAQGQIRCTRLVSLICQVLFYSLLIPVLLLAAGLLKMEDLTIYTLLQYVFPLQMEHYWFATMYVLTYLLSPFIRIAVQQMKQKQLLLTIALIMVFVSVAKTVLPVRLSVDAFGYDVIWFVCVFLCAAYIRKYGINWFTNARRGFGCYLLGCAGMFAVILVNRFIYLKFDMLGDVLSVSHHYNHLINIFAAIGLFYGFYHWKLPEGKVADLIVKAAPYTFGVYLLHEHIDIRYLWQQWLGATTQVSPVVFVLQAVGSVVCVLVIGLAIDWLRGKIFAAVAALLAGTKLAGLLKKADAVLSAEE